MIRIPRHSRCARFEKAVARLSPLERQILMLSARERLCREEIAARLGLSDEAVTARLAMALYRLDRHLERQARPWWRFW
jgi:DNA-directed RNA polymerase specialized sigma24 family protein